MIWLYNILGKTFMWIMEIWLVLQHDAKHSFFNKNIEQCLPNTICVTVGRDHRRIGKQDWHNKAEEPVARL